MVCGLEHVARGFEPHLLDGARGRLAGLQLERTTELPWTEVRDVREIFNRKGQMQVRFGVGQSLLHAVGLRLQFKQRGGLRLTTQPAVIHDHASR